MNRAARSSSLVDEANKIQRLLRDVLPPTVGFALVLHDLTGDDAIAYAASADMRGTRELLVDTVARMDRELA